MQELYKKQFAKAYFNMGMIYERIGDLDKAGVYYRKSIEKCEFNNDDPENDL